MLILILYQRGILFPELKEFFAKELRGLKHPCFKDGA